IKEDGHPQFTQLRRMMQIEDRQPEGGASVLAQISLQRIIVIELLTALAWIENLFVGDAHEGGRQHSQILAGRGRRIWDKMSFIAPAQQPALSQSSSAQPAAALGCVVSA